MPTCKRCSETFEIEAATRHETERLLRVHCPECEAPLGRYRRHGQRPDAE
jgi:hypothetical protein